MKMKIKNELVEIDENCVSLIQYFNNIELDTKFCCEGHSLNEDYYIMFQDYITDEQILNFIKKYSNKYNHTPFCGRFVKWARKMSDKIVLNWMYIAKYKEHAKIDYETIIKIDKKGIN